MLECLFNSVKGTSHEPCKPKPARVKRPRTKAVVPRERSRRTREKIINASLYEFSNKGYDGGRVDEIALRAGINKNVLYHHYGSKDSLFGAVLQHTYECIRARQEDIKLRTLDPETGMRRLVVYTGRIWVQFPDFQRMLTNENVVGGRHMAKLAAVPQLYNPLLATIEDLLERGTAEGVFRSGIDPVDLYISITSLTAHYVNNQHTFEAIFKQSLMTPQRVKQRLGHAADMIIRFLRADNP
jgi:TetR/AcrR family transcriptional regulator